MAVTASEVRKDYENGDENFYREDVSTLLAEIDRLRIRDVEARKVINAAFGEYSIMIKPGLNAGEIAMFEKNFAVGARKWLSTAPQPQ